MDALTLLWPSMLESVTAQMALRLTVSPHVFYVNAPVLHVIRPRAIAAQAANHEDSNHGQPQLKKVSATAFQTRLMRMVSAYVMKASPMRKAPTHAYR